MHSEEGQQATLGFAILGQDVVIFISGNMAPVVRAGQTSVSILSYLVHQQRFRADVFQIPQHRKALFESCTAF